MRKIFILLFIIFLGCLKTRDEYLPPQEFIISGIVRMHKEPLKNAIVELQVCKFDKWFEDSKNWVTTTDEFGRYKIKVHYDWFNCYYKIRASGVDKYDNFYRSDWEYGMVRFDQDRKDFWLGEITEKAEEEKARGGRRRRR